MSTQQQSNSMRGVEVMLATSNIAAHGVRANVLTLYVKQFTCLYLCQASEAPLVA